MSQLLERLHALIPDDKRFLSHSPEEMGGIILRLLKDEVRKDRTSAWIAANLANPETWKSFNRSDEVGRALYEAMSWLEQSGLIASYIGIGNQKYVFITRRGHEIESEADFETYRKSVAFPGALFHPDIAEAALSDFMRGDYESAVFKAFKEVEVEFRNISGVTTAPMEKVVHAAFTGPLKDLEPEMEDQKKLRQLVVAAMSYFRNSTAHRRVTVSIEEAVEAIGLASYVRRLADGKSATP